MKKFQYDMSIIMPIYNMEKYLDEAIKSVINQDYDFKKIQIVAINDGSKDNSLKILKDYKNKFDNIHIIDQENQGLSKTRNNGIKEATGKYIMFLDPDDTISSNTVSSLVEFFDKHYDEIDMVLYKIIPIKDGKMGKLHYRYNYLTQTGVYDLNDKNYRYSCVTTVNYAVKNLGKDNIYFDTTPGFRHEDQKFASEVLMKKLKLGYVEEAEYYYLQQTNSITHTYFHAYYLFDKAMCFWEEIYNHYPDGKVPQYYQNLFISDINWKTQSDILKPYQYEGDKFDQEYGRVLTLLNLVDDDVILNSPSISESYKHYFINLKNNNKFKVLLGENVSNVAVTNHDKLIYSKDYVKLNVLKFDIYEKHIDVIGYLVDPIFDYCSDNFKLYVISNHNFSGKKELKLRKSSYCYYNAKEVITNSYMFEEKINVQDVSNLKFGLDIGDASLDVKLNFVGTTPFDQNTPMRDEYYMYDNVYKIGKDDLDITIKKAEKKKRIVHNRVLNSFYFNGDIKRWAFRTFIKCFSFIKKDIWLYYDCKGVEKDNGYYQFMHDIEKKDGVKRYYVSANSKKQIKSLFPFKLRGSVIRFNSVKHKLLYLKSKRVITAYAEFNNCSPYTKKSLKNYSDLFIMPKIVYLQHGVLHAHMPWKYSFDRLLVDKEVVSTEFEKKNLIENYTFTEEHIIDAGMPRYDFSDNSKESKNRILFAPSWRNYLIGNVNNEWCATDDKFKSSSFYKETLEFLTSKKLHDLLEKYDFYLDFKLHPIFKRYQKFYKINSPRITFGEKNCPNSDYSIFITDYSSFVFDFVYLKRAIFYFFPDYDLFKAGLNIYRELDLPFEKGFGKMTTKSEDAIKEVEKLLKNKCVPDKIFYDRTNNFFIHNDNKQRQRIYEALIKKDK